MKLFQYNVVTIMLVTVILMSACTKPEETFGEAIRTKEVTPINEVVSNPQQFEGKTVRLEGTILAECPTGCWFDMRDEGGAMYVELHHSGFAIPQKVGSDIVVEGTVEMRDGKPILIGKGAELE